jgi:hypothetical protein
VSCIRRRGCSILVQEGKALTRYLVVDLVSATRVGFFRYLRAAIEYRLCLCG